MTTLIDKNGEPVEIGNVYEFEDLLFIITEDGARVFENIIEYGVDMPPEYIEVESIPIEDLQFEYAEKIGSIYTDEVYKELYNRPQTVHTVEDIDAMF